jgi:membrane peptidoglycan carboxypeptidase
MRRLAIILVKSVAALLFACVATSVAFAGWFVWYYSARFDIPSVEKFVAISPADRICSLNDERTFVPLAAIPAMVRNAVLAAVEPEFYDRWTTNPFSEVAHALVFDHRPRSAAISHAVSHCLMSLSSRCCKGQGEWHIGNLILMNRVDSNLSKDRIFEIYLNEAYFGRRARGIGAAAAAHFGKPVADLTLDEAASLAALPFAPNNYLRNTERWTERRNFVIDRMPAAGMVSAGEAASAKQRPWVLRPAPAPI